MRVAWTEARGGEIAFRKAGIGRSRFFLRRGNHGRDRFDGGALG